jgi:bifunctional DNA-binding transcriptional regulator/antitoxin component of YhaV-PrlF toxin-antitoxin module
MKLKLRAIGKSTSLVLPKQVLQRLNVKKDDFVDMVEIPGGYFLTPYDTDVPGQVRLGLQFMKKYRRTLRALAK